MASSTDSWTAKSCSNSNTYDCSYNYNSFYYYLEPVNFHPVTVVLQEQENVNAILIF